MNHTTSTACMVVLLAGCTPYELRDLRTPAVVMPESLDAPAPVLAVPEHWWLAFDEPGLDETVTQAFAENLDLRQAWARLQQAMAQATIVGAPVYPEVNLDGGAERRRTDSDVNR
ncbi:MAG: TolC family protein, partial [Planctomycetota bacterium]|nr:TolC family protein [Planctomycetota bacterium]